MSKDTPENEQVETLEDSISKVLDEQETDELVETEEAEADEDTEDEPEETEEAAAEDGETASAGEDDTGGDDDTSEEEADSPDIAAEAGDIPDDGGDKLEPPEHWSPIQKERFNGLPKEGQEFLMETHKSMEGDYTRKTQEIAPIRKQFEAIQESLAPFEQEFTRNGLDYAGAVRQLAAVHQGMRSDPRGTIKWLAQTYGVDLQADPEEGATDPALRSVLDEIGEIKTSLSRNEQQAKQVEHQRLIDQIKAFESETGDDGKLLRPHFQTVQDQMARLMESGLVERGDLQGAYDNAVRMAGLEVPKPPPVPQNADQAEKVKKAKRAATGVKSSGAVGKKTKPPAKTWDEEVARHVG